MFGIFPCSSRRSVSIPRRSASSVAIEGRYAYVADGRSGLRIVDVSNPANPVETGFFDTSGSASSVAVKSQYAYITTDLPWGVSIVDVSDPGRTTQVGFYKSPFGVVSRVALAGNCAYIAGGLGDLRIVDVSDPTGLVEVGSHVNRCSLPSWTIFDVATDGSYIYVPDPWVVCALGDSFCLGKPVE